MIDIDALEARIVNRDESHDPLLPNYYPEFVLELIAEIRRICSILSDYSGTPQAELMARVEKLERENRALGKMLGERKAHRKCPCGGLPKLQHSNSGRFYIACDDCECTTDYFWTRKEAWAAWDGVA